VNPVAAILSGGMMFDWLGNKFNDPQAVEVGRKIEKATEAVLNQGRVKTPDLGGTHTTLQMTEAIIKEIK
jgi:isocitrate/isopropylmalate dehydrogenase